MIQNRTRPAKYKEKKTYNWFPVDRLLKKHAQNDTNGVEGTRLEYNSNAATKRINVSDNATRYIQALMVIGYV